MHDRVRRGPVEPDLRAVTRKGMRTDGATSACREGGVRGETAGMTTARSLTLSDAAEVCGTTKKALERRAERGTLTVGRRGGVRVVDVAELLRVGLLASDAQVSVPRASGPMDRPLAVLARRVAEADDDLTDLRAALVSTEAALRRARDESRVLRTRLAALATGAQPEMVAETA